MVNQALFYEACTSRYVHYFVVFLRSMYLGRIYVDRMSTNKIHIKIQINLQNLIVFLESNTQCPLAMKGPKWLHLSSLKHCGIKLDVTPGDNPNRIIKQSEQVV